MITLFSCHIIVSFIIPSLSTMRKTQSIIALHIASDLFVKDVHAMKNSFYDWKLMTPHELIWHNDKHDIGWCFSNNSLERKEGVYNKKWTNKTTSIVATGIEKLTFTIEKDDNHIVGIELALIPIVNKKEPIICYVALIEKKKL